MQDKFTWTDLKACRDKSRDAQVESVMKIVEQRPFIDICVGSIPSRSALKAASRYPLCDGVLIIFNPLRSEDENEEALHE
jgi:hypothetical protein